MADTLRDAREALDKAALTLAEAAVTFRLFGKPDAGRAMGIAEDATREAVDKIDAHLARLGSASVEPPQPVEVDESLTVGGPDKCRPALTECPRCKNVVGKCDGLFKPPAEPKGDVPLLTEHGEVNLLLLLLNELRMLLRNGHEYRDRDLLERIERAREHWLGKLLAGRAVVVAAPGEPK